MKKFEAFKHTEGTIKLFNSILNDYKKIQSNSELRKRKLLYDDYKNLGYIIDSLRYDGKASTYGIESIKNYFKNLGCTIKKNVIKLN